MADGVTLRLELRHEGFDRVLAERTAEPWIRSLAEVPEPRRLVVAGAAPLSPETAGLLRELCTAHGVELTDAVGDDGIVVLADAADLPGPRLVPHLIDVARTGVVADARPIPLGAPAAGAPLGACVALPIETWVELGRPTGDALPPAVRAARTPFRSVADAPVFHDVRVSDDCSVVSPAGPQPTGPVGADPERPFLTIVTRTQGTRPSTLADTLTCLAAQTEHDFELVLACHRATPAGRAVVGELVAALPGWLRDRVRLLDVERAGRSAPLNEGFAAATGRYIVSLDDDDTVLSHWVETFRHLAERSPGRVLRAGAIRQDVVPVIIDDAAGSRTHLIAKSGPIAEWPGEFSLLDHLYDNQSPFMSVAFPREVVTELGHRFDEDLPTTEDWEFLMRAVAAVGVASTPERTCVYRLYAYGASRTEHDKQEWDRAREVVLRNFDALTFELPPGGAGRAHQLGTEIARLNGEVARLRHDQAADHLARLQASHDQAVAERDAYLSELSALRAHAAQLEAANQELREQVAAGRSRAGRPAS